MNCQDVNDLLPELAKGDLPPDGRREVERHLQECEPCAETWGTVRALEGSRPAIPEGLESRIRTAVRTVAGEAPDGVLRLEPRARPRIPSWALGAAALMVLAIGTPLVVDRMPEAPVTNDDDELAMAERTLTPSVWASDDGLMAGAPALDGLSDEALLALLAELEEGA